MTQKTCPDSLLTFVRERLGDRDYSRLRKHCNDLPLEEAILAVAHVPEWKTTMDVRAAFPEIWPVPVEMVKTPTWNSISDELKLLIKNRLGETMAKNIASVKGGSVSLAVAIAYELFYDLKSMNDSVRNEVLVKKLFPEIWPSEPQVQICHLCGSHMQAAAAILEEKPSSPTEITEGCDSHCGAFQCDEVCQLASAPLAKEEELVEKLKVVFEHPLNPEYLAQWFGCMPSLQCRVEETALQVFSGVTTVIFPNASSYTEVVIVCMELKKALIEQSKSGVALLMGINPIVE